MLHYMRQRKNIQIRTQVYPLEDKRIGIGIHIINLLSDSQVFLLGNCAILKAEHWLMLLGGWVLNSGSSQISICE